MAVAIALITLTHLGPGPYGNEKPYDGRVILDANRIESIEEINIDGEKPVTYVVMQSHAAHCVAETADQVIAMMTEAINA